MIILPSMKGFPHKPSTPLSSPMLLLDASNVASYPGSGTVWYDISGSGNNFNIVEAAWNPAGYMDFKGNYGIAKNGADIDLSGEVTYVVVTKIKNYPNTFDTDLSVYDADWRTLTRPYGGDHYVIVESFYYQYDETKIYNIGMYDNDSDQFLDSGAKQNELPGYSDDKFDVMIWRFSDSDNPTWDMNVNGVQVGTISDENARHSRGFGAIGGYHYENPYPESAAQYWGDIKYFAAYDKRLNDTEVNAIYQSLKNRRNNPDVLFRLDPSDTSGYSTSGSTWYDLSGNGRDVVFSNEPVINSNNGGVFYLSRYDDQNLRINNTDFRTGQYTIMYAVRNPKGWDCLTSVYDSNYNLGYRRSSNGEEACENIYYAGGCILCDGVLLNSQNPSNWRIYTGTVDTLNGDFKLYKNGILIDSGYGTSGPYGIGINYGNGNAGGAYLSKTVAEIGFITAYNKVLTDFEIFAFYEANKSRFGLS